MVKPKVFVFLVVMFIIFGTGISISWGVEPLRPVSTYSIVAFDEASGQMGVAESLPLFKKVFSMDKRWVELLKLLPGVDQFPKDKELMKKILSQAR